MKRIPPVFTDGALYVMIAIFGATETVFSSEEAFKYISPYVIWWIKATCSILLGGVGALKMFRSTTYSEHVAKSNAKDVAVTTDTIRVIKTSSDTTLPTQ